MIYSQFSKSVDRVGVITALFYNVVAIAGVGMLPVKEKAGDALSWKLVEEQEPCGGAEAGEAGSGSRGMSRLSDTSSHSLPDSVPTEAKVFIDMSGRNGLGCW